MILDSVLNEVYISDSSVTSKIVNVFEKMAKIKISENNDKAIKLVHELRNAFKEFTNANRVEIEIDDMGSCFTIPPMYNPPPDFKLTNKGIRFANNNDVYICININPKWVFKHKVHDEMKLTPRELTAILLHEVGHNFSHAVIPIHDLLETMKLAIQIRNMKTIEMSNDTQNNMNILTTIQNQFKENLSKILVNSNNMIENGKLMISGLLSSLSTVNRERYLDEKIADSFATTYGFGKELSSGLHKLDKYFLSKSNKEFSKLGGILAGTFFLSISILFDEHPQDVSRMTSQIDQLEYELEHNAKLSKKDIAQMKKDIRGIRTVISQYNTITKSDKFSLPFKLYSNFLTDYLGGEEIMSKITKTFLNPAILDMAYKRNA